MKQLSFLAVLFVYAGLAVAYSIVVPLGETPDETEHFRYFQHIVTTAELPIMVADYDANVTIEAHQPPLLYMVGAGLFGRFAPDPADGLVHNHCFSYQFDDPGRQNAYLHNASEWPPQTGMARAFYALRWLSVGMGMITLWIAWRLAYLLTDDHSIALATAALLAFNPQWLFITSSFNNDVPSTMLGGAAIWLAVLGAKHGRYRHFLLLGSILGAGILSKFSLIAYLPLAGLAILWAAWLRPHGRIRTLLVSGLLVFVPVLLIAGWWYVRNGQLYGDPLMWEITLAAKGAVIARDGTLTLADIWAFAVLHFRSYWAWFGWLNVRPGAWVHALYLLFVLAGCVGLARWRNWWKTPFWVFPGLAVLAVYAALLQYIRTINWTGYQGRLAFTAAVPIALFLAVGWSMHGRKPLRTITILQPIAPLLLLIFVIRPAYDRAHLFSPPPAAQLTCARFADGWQLEAMTADETIAPDKIRVTLHGFGLQTGDGQITISLLAADGSRLAETAVQHAWQAGAADEVTAMLDVPAVSAPLHAFVQVSVRDNTATSATGRVLAVPHTAGTTRLMPATPEVIPADALPLDVAFGEQIKLTAVRFDAETVTVWWQALDEITADYTVFLHHVDDDGQLLAQADRPPTNGRFPTTSWRTGEVVKDTHPFAVPSGSRLAIGLYTAEGRLAAVRDGVVLPDGRFVLTVP